MVDSNPNVGSKVYIIPESDHNLHMDNPIAFANCIINDILGENLPVEASQTAEEDYQADFINQANEVAETNQDQEEEQKK